jgi:hypothetical protein
MDFVDPDIDAKLAELEREEEELEVRGVRRGREGARHEGHMGVKGAVFLQIFLVFLVGKAQACRYALSHQQLPVYCRFSYLLDLLAAALTPLPGPAPGARSNATILILVCILPDNSPPAEAAPGGAVR